MCVVGVSEVTSFFFAPWSHVNMPRRVFVSDSLALCRRPGSFSYPSQRKCVMSIINLTEPSSTEDRQVKIPVWQREMMSGILKCHALLRRR